MIALVFKDNSDFSLAEISHHQAHLVITQNKCTHTKCTIYIYNYNYIYVKHKANDSKCAELGWVCIPIAVETYGCWGTEAKWALSQLASRLATHQNCPKSAAITALYQRLSMTLVRANVRALLSRAISDTGY